MNQSKYLQERQHWRKQQDSATKRIAALDKAYIKANAPYPVKSIVTVADASKTQTLRIASYDIDENIQLKPCFETLGGKCVFLNRPEILGLVNNKL